jgi:protein SCO1
MNQQLAVALKLKVLINSLVRFSIFLIYLILLPIHFIGPFAVFASSSTLPQYAEVSAFEFMDQGGSLFHQDQLKGHVWIADFIFTRCQGMCPLMSGQMAVLQKELADSEVKFISFTVDPDYDTPKVLNSYAKTHGALEGKWFFLTGAKEEMRKLVISGFQLGVADATDDDVEAGAESVIHSGRFVLVDQKGVIRGYYDHQEPLTMKKLIEDALMLERE